MKEANFNPDELEFTDFSAADVNRRPRCRRENSLKEEMTNALREAEWKEENGTYTAENVLVFDTDAEYDFTLKCMDLAGNSGSYEEDEPFIIDQEAPAALKSHMKQNRSVQLWKICHWASIIRLLLLRFPLRMIFPALIASAGLMSRRTVRAQL